MEIIDRFGFVGEVGRGERTQDFLGL